MSFSIDIVMFNILVPDRKNEERPDTTQGTLLAIMETACGGKGIRTPVHLPRGG
jgi:hypothetical protein